MCVLDALDECQESSRSELMKALGSYRQNVNLNSTPNLKFLVTSRPYQHLKSEFDMTENMTHKIHLKGEGEAEVDQISKEIDLVIRDNVDRLEKKLHLTTEHCSKLYDRLTEIPQRTYLWVHLALSELERSSLLLLGNVDQAISDVGTSVYGVYEKILNRSPDHQQAKRILQIIIAAYRPQTVSEVFTALHIMSGQGSGQHTLENLPSIQQMWEVVRNSCGLFLSRVTNKIYLIHQTAKEFLVAQ